MNSSELGLRHGLTCYPQVKLYWIAYIKIYNLLKDNQW